MEQAVAVDVERKDILLPWWLILLDGLLIVLLGVLLVVDPQSTLILIIRFLGAYWFITGIVQIAGAFVHREHRLANIFIGLLGLSAGAIVFLNPLMGEVIVPGVIIIVLGAEGVLMGAAALWQAFKGAGSGRFLFGLFSFVIGCILLFNEPFAVGVAALPFALAVFSFFIGPIVIVAAFGVRGLKKA